MNVDEGKWRLIGVGWMKVNEGRRSWVKVNGSR